MAIPSEQLDRGISLARLALSQGNSSAAEAELLSLIRVDPQCIPALHGLCAVYSSMQAYGRALQAALAILTIVPSEPEALAIAAGSNLNLGEFSQSELYARRLVALQPSNSRALFVLSCALSGSGRNQESLQILERALAQSPFDPELMAAKAQLLARLNWTSQAIEWYRKSLKLAPNPELALEYSQLLREEGFTETAVDALQVYLQTNSVSPKVQEAAAQALTEAHRFDEAEVCWQAALRFGAEPGKVLEHRIQSEVFAGRLEVAKDLIAAELAENPNHLELYATFASIRKFTTEEAPVIDQMERLLASAMDFELKRDLAFALGKAYADISEYELAMARYDHANRLAYEGNANARKFDAKAWRWYTSQQINFFSREQVNHLQPQGSRAEGLLFILGMIRSGTTLSEQILSRHSQIAAGGEKTFWADHRDEIFDAGTLKFDSIEASKLANAYTKLMKPYQGTASWITEKNPANITIAGLIACIYPQAKFLHVKRHPVDNLLSIWMTPLRTGLPFVNCKKNLVAAYKEYLRMEAHLVQVLPESQFRTVTYEDLTSHPEATVGGILNWLGLDSEEDCLHPESNPRTVRTPSFYQVRQPISTSSQNKWKHYLPWLGEFEELL